MFMHTLRSLYGWTDEQILWHIQEFGKEWIDETTELINEQRKRELEEEVERRRWAIHVAPISRTPMDSSGGNSLESYRKSLLRELDKLVPWREEERKESIRKRLKEPPQNVEPITIE